MNGSLGEMDNVRVFSSIFLLLFTLMRFTFRRLFTAPPLENGTLGPGLVHALNRLSREYSYSFHNDLTWPVVLLLKFDTHWQRVGMELTEQESDVVDAKQFTDWWAKKNARSCQLGIVASHLVDTDEFQRIVKIVHAELDNLVVEEMEVNSPCLESFRDTSFMDEFCNTNCIDLVEIGKRMDQVETKVQVDVRLVDNFRKVIGKGKQVINNLQTDHQVVIQVPAREARDGHYTNPYLQPYPYPYPYPNP